MLYNNILIDAIKDYLKDNKLTLSVAESVTAGHLQAAFSSATEASLFFQGGITAYNVGQKARHLNIEPIEAIQCNCVSDTVASKMALQVNLLFLSNYGIGITGYATKVPEMGINELFAFFAIAFNQEIILSEKITSNKENSIEAQLDFTNQIIQKLYDTLNEKGAK